MEKKSYIQPTSELTDYKLPIMEGPMTSVQFDDGSHLPIGDDNGEDDFTGKEREEENPWGNGLW